MKKMQRIVIVGAGGAGFSQNFIRDFLLDDKLRDKFEISLMDINEERLQVAVEAADITADVLGVKYIRTATTNLKEALKDAKYVLTVFRCGDLCHQEIEYKVPLKYGVDQVVGDTVGPGGVFRGLRTLKALFEIVDAMEEVCPGAYLFNYVNPMSMNTIALSRRAKTVKVIGLCHSVQHTSKQLCEYLGIDRKDLRFQCAGINHQAFMLKLEANGKDLYPELRKCLDKPEVYKRDKVRFELFRHFGYFPTESSGHGSEYVQYFRKRQELIDRYCCNDYPDINEEGIDWNTMGSGLSGAALEIVAKLRQRVYRFVDDYRAGKDVVKKESSNEYGIQLIHAMTCDEPMEANLNVMNNGLIPTLPPGCSVEVPCLVNGGGIQPCRIENYPEQLAGLNRQMINLQMLGAEGALNCDREAIIRAIYFDPNASSKLSLDELRQMTEELFESLRSEIEPGFFI